MLASRFRKILFSLAVLATTAVFVTPSQAVPAFARQTGKACASCHFQHYPALNDYGRDFKASGYVDMGKQGTVKGTKDNELSLPEMLNASVFLKVRHQQSNGSDLPDAPTTASGQWQAPDEFALLLGGRVAPNIGFLIEAQLIDGAAPTLAGFKMPMIYNVAGKKAGIIPFTTDALGVAYGFELLNTGAVRNVRVAEHRNETSAQQYIGTATGAVGAAFVVSDASWFANFSRWAPHHIEGLAGVSLSSNYFRAAYMPAIGDWDLGFGGQMWSGGSNGANTNAWALDAQMQGLFMSRPVGLYLTYANAEAPKAGETNLFNTAPNAKTAATIMVEYGIIPNKATLQLAYRSANNGKNVDSGDNAVTLGGTYQLAQNVQLQLQHSNRAKAGNNGRYEGSSKPGDTLTTLMLSAGF